MNRYDKESDSKNNSVEMHGFQFLPVAATGLIVTKFKMAANAKLREDTVCINRLVSKLPVLFQSSQCLVLNVRALRSLPMKYEATLSLVNGVKQ